MKHKIYIVALILLSVVAPIQSSWFGNDNSRKQQASKITSDREYITAENDEKQIDQEIKQVQAEMDEDRNSYREFDVEVIDREIAVYVMQCKNPEKPCDYTGVQKLIQEKYNNFGRAINTKYDKLKKLYAYKQQSRNNRDIYLEVKDIRHNELSTLLWQIERYVSQEDCNKHKSIIEKAKKLATGSIAPDMNCLVDLEMYQSRKTELHEKFASMVAHGRFNELLELYPEDHDTKRIYAYRQDNSLKSDFIIEEINKLYTKKTKAYLADCKKLVDSLSEELREEFNSKIEASKNDIKKLNELYKQYAEKNDTVAEENNNN